MSLIFISQCLKIEKNLIVSSIIIIKVQKSLFPEIKTHNYNIPLYALSPDNTLDLKTILKQSLQMIGNETKFETSKIILNKIYKNKEKWTFLVRGPYGSGKSLFVRKIMTDFLNQFKELKNYHL